MYRYKGKDMISQTTNSTVRMAYQSKTNGSKETKQSTQSTTQNERSRVDQLKESINSKEYKVNIQATAQKMAENLLS